MDGLTKSLLLDRHTSTQQITVQSSGGRLVGYKLYLQSISVQRTLKKTGFFYKTVHSSAATTLGHPSRKHQGWFDENDDKIQRLLGEKHRLHKAQKDDTSSISKKATYSNICNTVQTKLRDMQNSWVRKKTEEIQSFADRKDMKKLMMH